MTLLFSNFLTSIFSSISICKDNFSVDSSVYLINHQLKLGRLIWSAKLMLPQVLFYAFKSVTCFYLEEASRIKKKSSKFYLVFSP